MGPPSGRAAPDSWEEVLRRIKAEREAGPRAPVDEAGCEVLADPTADAKARRFHVLVALFLSSQTKDAVTAAAVKALQRHGLTPERLHCHTTEEEIDAMIAKVGFHRTKAKRLKEVARLCLERHGGDIPASPEELMALPGVGPKMAFLAMNVAWGQPAGIGVDTHVHRIANRLGWAATRTPEATRKALEAWLPVEEWIGVNPTLVGFGQLRCLPQAPKCRGCPVGELCPTGRGDLPLVPKSPASSSPAGKGPKKAKKRKAEPR
mmetsp:Transcript_3123/g.8470  ORF Transcript_3123/g.8470 Transcript_3123/m.8470 type:complete len:263 (+) Transcript_3123:1-789(+)